MTITFSVLVLFLSAKNPIWGYHFTGIEIMFLFFLGLVLTKIPVLRFICLALVIFVGFIQISNTIKGMSLNPLRIDSLKTKEYIVSQVLKDAKDKPYTVFAYNSAIYMYDYSYLFRWLGNKSFSYDPGNIKNEGDIYLILPINKKSILDDFIHYKTPDLKYKTAEQWQVPDGTVILKRIKINKI
jgi:hypothetical protein